MSNMFQKFANLLNTFTPRQWGTLLSISTSNFFGSAVYSLQAPFYPIEATKKGASATEYGLVMGCFELVTCIVSPIYGMYINRIGPSRLYILGIITISVAVMCFGLLDGIESHFWFVFFSFVLRIVEAFGYAGLCVGTFTVIPAEFPNNSGIFVIFNMFWGLGLMLGPVIGGILYDLGGYKLPFLAIGAVLLCVGVSAVAFSPKLQTVHPSQTSHNDEIDSVGVLSILRVREVVFFAIVIIIASSSFGFLFTNIEEHLKQFSLTSTQVGLVIMTYGVTFSGFSFVVGRICDTIEITAKVPLAGAILILIGYLAIGPAPFIPISTKLWLVVVGVGMQGIGLTASEMPNLICALKEAVEHGFPDNVATYGAVSGLWTTCTTFGTFLGNSVGGILYDLFGFRNASYYVIGTQAVAITLLFSIVIEKGKRRRFREETTPLMIKK